MVEGGVPALRGGLLTIFWASQGLNLKAARPTLILK